MSVPTITLNDGRTIPQLGFGTFQIPPEETKQATLTAIEVGYRHIDTAEMYGNEKGVGEAIRESGVDRSEFYVTSKLNNTFHGKDKALAAFDQSMKDLDIDYLDLFLIHWPLPEVDKYVETWQALEEIVKTGRAKSVGVSNFQPAHLDRLVAETELVPAINQIEVHPYLTNEAARAANAKYKIATEAWSPIAKGNVLTDPVITQIAERVDRTPAQVTLRWAIQRGDIVFPKSVTRARVEENFNLFDFELTADDIAAISALNKDERTGPDPDTFNHQ